jgi:hypothetical protein
MTRHVLLVALLAIGTGCTARQAVVTSTQVQNTGFTSGNWIREELYFGRAMPNGSIVSDSAFNAFVEREIAPRFPDGFTLTDALGYYRVRTTGVTIREPSQVLIVYVPEDQPARTQSLNELITIYKGLFRQESVLHITTRVRASLK